MSGKKLVDALKSFDRDQFYTPVEALGIVKKTAKGTFDESVDVAVRLGVDPRKADQMVRGTVALPSGTGKDVRVAVFATGEAAQEARDAGADIIGADDLAAQVEAGKFDFDVAIATPDMMPLVGRLGRALGPRGLMPNPKTGTVTQDVGRAVSEFKGGKVEYRTDRYGNVHVPIGKATFEPAALEANFRAVLDELQPGQASGGQGPLPEQDHGLVDDGPRRSCRHQPAAPTRSPLPEPRRGGAQPDQLNPSKSEKPAHFDGDCGPRRVRRLDSGGRRLVEAKRSFDDLGRDVDEAPVVGAGVGPEHREGLSDIDPIPFGDDTFCLLDDDAAVQGDVQLFVDHLSLDGRVVLQDGNGRDVGEGLGQGDVVRGRATRRRRGTGSARRRSCFAAASARLLRRGTRRPERRSRTAASGCRPPRGPGR